MADILKDTLDVAREAVKPRSFSRPFWAATRDKRLVLQYDRTNGQYQFFPRATGIATGRRALEWREVSGKG